MVEPNGVASGTHDQFGFVVDDLAGATQRSSQQEVAWRRSLRDLPARPSGKGFGGATG
jgi:hypothetical protein